MHEAKRGRWLRRPSVFLAAALVAGTGFAIVPASVAAAAPTSLCPTANVGLFGPNVCVFTTAMPEPTIQADLNAIASQQVPVTAQFNDEGYALLFEPGTYGSPATPLVFQAGYYTEVAGLGAVPQDTVINGQIEVLANVVDCASPSNCWGNSDDNFWRSMSNLTLNVENNNPNAYVPTPITELSPINVGYGGYCFYGTGPLAATPTCGRLRKPRRSAASSSTATSTGSSTAAAPTTTPAAATWPTA